MDHDRTHSDSIKLYTDGSKTPDGVGCAVVHGSCSYSGRLSDNASVFTAELTALEKSLQVISTLHGRKFTIYSDSYSALLAIKVFNSPHPIVQQIMKSLIRLKSRLKEIHFCWVPAHVGIPGNEFADREAKAVITRENISFNHIPVNDLKTVIRKYVRNQWQERWARLTNNRKYENIRQSIDHWP